MSHENNKVAIVTGASRGIGAAIAERLARDGFTVIVNYSGDSAPAEALARKIEAKGAHALTVKADVSNAQAVRRMFDAAETTFGGVDVLVNNAGIMKLAPLADSGEPERHLQRIARSVAAPAQWRTHRQFLHQRRRPAA